MAELYPKGVQRIFYRASTSASLVVTGKLFDSSLEVESNITFTKLSGTQKIYYADVDFYIEGIWVVVFYENGVEKTEQAYNTKKLPTIGKFRAVGSQWLGPSVI